MTSHIFTKALGLQSMLLLVALIAGVGISWPISVSAVSTTYYVSPSGNDSASGVSPQEAWKTIEQVNRGVYKAGDRILLEGGQRFSGTVGFSPATAFGTKD